MKPKIRTPYFEIGTKNYIYGDKVLEYALAADKAAEKYDIDVLFICPAVEIRRVAENTKHLIVLAPYMDTLRPGRGMADTLPEGLKAAGAQGVVINHCEKPMSLPQMKATIDRSRELDFLVFACADTLDEAKAIAQLHPDIINPEPSAASSAAATASAPWPMSATPSASSRRSTPTLWSSRRRASPTASRSMISSWPVPRRQARPPAS